MSSLFLRLFTYRQRDGRSPEEDFFTEAFAGVLRASLPLRVRFVDWLIDCPHEVDSVDISTQRVLDGGDRVDIWIEARSDRGKDRHVLVMENKISAPVDEAQLRRYENQLKREATANTRTLTLVCATRDERASFEPSPCGSAVAFKDICWHEVADWLRWLSQQPDGLNEPGVHLVHELLLLMEDWKMAIHLTADDLAATTRHRTTVEGHLLQLLDEVWAECKLPNGQGKWAYDNQQLNYTSPQFTKDMEARAEFGFDFDRDDADWSVPQLGLPSAYFAVVGTEGPELATSLKALDWAPPPEEEDWGDDCLRAKRLDSLNVTGASLHPTYLDFFRTAREELWQALGL